MYFKNKELISCYIKNSYVSKNQSLKNKNIKVYYDEEDRRILKNYDTIISYIETKKDYKKIFINKKYYSKTTSTIQNEIQRQAEENGLTVETY